MKPGFAKSPVADERFTTADIDAWCRRKAEVSEWDLDVAACDEHHLAPVYFTKTTNGLSARWSGRVFCNPPYSDIESWVQKAALEISRDDGPTVVAVLVPATRTEQKWWQTYVEPYRDRPNKSLSTFFLPGRTNFSKPGMNGKAQTGSPFGCVLLVFRAQMRGR